MSGLLGRVLPRRSPSIEDERLAAVGRLSDALEHASLVEDRRAAAQALRSASRQYRREIAGTALPRLLSALHTDADDAELVRAVLSTLVALSTGEDESAATCCGMVLQAEGSLAAIASVLPLGDAGDTVAPEAYAVVFEACALLNVLHACDARGTCAALLSQAPDAVARLVHAVAAAQRGAVREHAAHELLVLLEALCASSNSVRRVAVFGGLCEELLGLVRTCMGAEHVLAVPALRAAAALFRDNPSGQRYFCETPALLHAASLLLCELTEAAEGHGDCSALVAFLAVLSSILPPPASPRLPPTQEALLRTGCLEALCALAQTDSAAVRSAACDVLSRLMARNAALQARFARTAVVAAAIGSPGADGWRGRTPAVFAALAAVLSEAGGGAADLLAVYLAGNADGQLAIASTLRAPEDAPSAGSLLVDALVGQPPAGGCGAVCAAADALALVLADNAQCKGVALAHTVGDAGQPLLAVAVLEPVQGAQGVQRADVLLARLCLLAVWLQRSPPTVGAFLARGADVQALVELCSEASDAPPEVQGAAALVLGLAVLYHPGAALAFGRAALADVLRRRVGGDVFVARLARLRDAAASLPAEHHVAGSVLGTQLAFRRVLAAEYARACALVAPAVSSAGNTLSRGVQTDDAEDDLQRSLVLENEALRAQLAEAVSAMHARDAAAVRHAAGLSAALGELAALRESSAHPSALEDHLRAENARLAQLAEAYAAQMLAIERDSEDLMGQLAAYDAELRQLRAQIAGAPSPSVACLNVGDAAGDNASFFATPPAADPGAATGPPAGSLYCGISPPADGAPAKSAGVDAPSDAHSGAPMTARPAAISPPRSPSKAAGILRTLLVGEMPSTTATDV